MSSDSRAPCRTRNAHVAPDIVGAQHEVPRPAVVPSRGTRMMTHNADVAGQTVDDVSQSGKGKLVRPSRGNSI